MTPISFPNLNLSFNINPVAITFFGISIYWYGILIASALAISLYLCKKNDGLFGIKYDDALNYAVIGILIGILCARLYYVIFHWDFYGANWIEILKINHRRSSNLWRHYRCFFDRLDIL